MSQQYLINVVYEHLRPEEIHSVHRGDVSVIISPYPLIDCHVYAYVNAYSYRGKQKGIDVLLLFEPMVVLPGQYDVNVWKNFDYVVTLYDAVIKMDPDKFRKVPFFRSGWLVDAPITENIDERNKKYPIANRKNAICMINGNKSSMVPGELYSKRIEAANWFNDNSDIPFDIYGNPPFSLPNFKGTLGPDEKFPILSQYKYSLCFENTNHPVYSAGYVEKIFDCLEARTIPIYLGAPDIEEHVPKECFIDFRNFKTYEELNAFLHAMDDARYGKYIDSIDRWVSQGGLRPYSFHAVYDRLAEILASTIKTDASALFGSSVQWQDGLSPLCGELNMTNAGEAVWTYSGLADGTSPLLDGADVSDPDTKLLLAAGKHNEAMEELKKVIQLSPQNSDAHRDLGVLYFQQGNHDKAIEHLKAAVLNNGKNYLAILNLLEMLVNLKHYDDATATLKTLLEDSPKDGQILAIAQKIIGNIQEGTGSSASASTDNLRQDDKSKDAIGHSPSCNSLITLKQSGLWHEGDVLRLHLGCGENHFDGYVNIDYPPSQHSVQTHAVADIFADITSLDFPDNSVDEIRSHHVFEHFTRPHALALLIRWHAWLKIGGKLHLETPDILECSRMLTSNMPYKVKQAILRHAFGSHEAHWANHLDGWYDEKFRYVLSKLGFDVQCQTYSWEVEPYLPNIHVFGVKKANLSRSELLKIADDILLDSLVADVSGERQMHIIWCEMMREHLNGTSTNAESSYPSLDNIEIKPDSPELDNVGFDNCDPIENGEVKVLSSLIRSNDIVFDVGANKGQWSKKVLAIKSGINLYAFEPVPLTFAALKQTLESTKSNLFNVAISDEDAEKTFYSYSNNPDTDELSSFYRRFDVERALNLSVNPIKVKSQTLDSFCKEHGLSHINFLKIDTEGGELDVLLGAKELLRMKKISTIQFEYGGTFIDAKITLKQVFELLSNNGYSLYRLIPDGLVNISKWRDTLENYHYSNYLAMLHPPKAVNSISKKELVASDNILPREKNVSKHIAHQSFNLRGELNKIDNLQAEGKYIEAIQIAEDILTLVQDSDDLYHAYANLLYCVNKIDRALEMLQKGISINPRNSNAYKDIGLIYFKKGDYQNAFDNLKSAVLADKQNYSALGEFIDLLKYLSGQGLSIDPVSIVKEIYSDGIYNIYSGEARDDLKRALVVYVGEAIPWYVTGKLSEFPYLNSHSMWWESAEIVRLLNKHGYVVDWVGLGSQNVVDKAFDWNKYDLVIDAGENNLCKAPADKNRVKVYYSTGKHWLAANMAELLRIKMFRERHGILMPQDRMQGSNLSDECADYLTYFGNESQLQGYSPNAKKVSLDISSVYIPEPQIKNIETARNQFMWLGGQAMIHKGLDLVVDAFSEIPDATLHIGAFMHTEPKFYEWLKPILEKNRNIIFHGSLNVASQRFAELAWNCIGTVYVSCAEGGPGSVAQLLHFGLIPVVTNSSNVRAEGLGYIVEGDSDVDIIEGIKQSVRKIIDGNKDELQKKCDAVQRFALAHHTRDAYSRSFDSLIKGIADSTKGKEAIAGVIFSKDRAMQLDCCLNSFFKHCQDPENTKLKVLYTTSSAFHEKQYNILKDSYPMVRFISEKDFRNDLISAIDTFEYILFIVDDNIFVQAFSLSDIVETLHDNKNVLGFSLRLGKNTDYCYMLNKNQAFPEFHPQGKSILKFNWVKSELDFGYPLEVSSSVYRVSDILPILTQNGFKNPNTLEVLIDNNKSAFAGTKDELLCYERSVAFCNPVNMVQTAWTNRAGASQDYSPEKLAEMFDKGYRIDTGIYDGFVPRSCHQEVKYEFIMSAVNGHVEEEKLKQSMVSIGIPNFNGIQHIQLCLESIRRNTADPYEVIVVDNGSTDGSREYLREQKDIILIENPENVGAPGARNQFLALSKGDYIVFLDNDTVVTRGWTTRLIRHMESDPQIGIIGACSNYATGLQGIAGVPYKNIDELEMYAAARARDYFGQLPSSPRLISFCVFIRRAAVEKIGAMETGFSKFCFEDDDYSIRIFIAGYKSVVANDVFIHHTGGPQGRGDKQYNKWLLDAWEGFKKKWELPEDLPFGSSYDLNKLVSQPFKPKLHFIPLPERSAVDKLIYKSSQELSEEISHA